MTADDSTKSDMEAGTPQVQEVKVDDNASPRDIHGIKVSFERSEGGSCHPLTTRTVGFGRDVYFVQHLPLRPGQHCRGRCHSCA